MISSELYKRIITSIVLLSIMGWAFFYSIQVFSILLCSIMSIILYFEMPALIPIKNKFMSFLFMIGYPLVPFLSLLWLVNSYYESDQYISLYPFCIAWAADTGGYFVGKLCGTHKIFKKLSPGKSWEGLLGSMIMVYIVTFFMLQKSTNDILHMIPNHIFFMIIWALVFTLIAFSGGMIASYLKRNKGLKDAGWLLPGHGGFLDRFDSVLMVSVFLTVILLVLKNGYFVCQICR